MEIIVRKWEHYNKSFKNWDHPTKGKWINSKAQYDECMAREGMIPYEKAREISANREKQIAQSYNGISEKAKVLISSVNKGKNGKIKLSDKQIDGLKEVGAKLSLPDWCPSHYKSGGFSK